MAHLLGEERLSDANLYKKMQTATKLSEKFGTLRVDRRTFSGHTPRCGVLVPRGAGAISTCGCEKIELCDVSIGTILETEARDN